MISYTWASCTKQVSPLIGKLPGLWDVTKDLKPLILLTLVLLELSFHFAADLSYHYKDLSEANRNRILETPLSGPVLCDNQLSIG